MSETKHPKLLMWPNLVFKEQKKLITKRYLKYRTWSHNLVKNLQLDTPIVQLIK
jgi:hypothetical protein